MRQGILTPAAAERLDVPHLANMVVTYDLKWYGGSIGRYTAINIFYQEEYLGNTIDLGKDGILPLDEQNDHR